MHAHVRDAEAVVERAVGRAQRDQLHIAGDDEGHRLELQVDLGAVFAEGEERVGPGIQRIAYAAGQRAMRRIDLEDERFDGVHGRPRRVAGAGDLVARVVALVDEQCDALRPRRREVFERGAQRRVVAGADAEGAVDVDVQVASDHGQAARGGGAQQIFAGAGVGEVQGVELRGGEQVGARSGQHRHGEAVLGRCAHERVQLQVVRERPALGGPVVEVGGHDEPDRHGAAAAERRGVLVGGVAELGGDRLDALTRFGAQVAAVVERLTDRRGRHAGALGDVAQSHAAHSRSRGGW